MEQYCNLISRRRKLTIRYTYILILISLLITLCASCALGNAGIIDIYDKDKDNDGIRDIYDKDFDNDGIPNRYDNDIDNDGISDKYDKDNDNDGIANRYDRDHDY